MTPAVSTLANQKAEIQLRALFYLWEVRSSKSVFQPLHEEKGR